MNKRVDVVRLAPEVVLALLKSLCVRARSAHRRKAFGERNRLCDQHDTLMLQYPDAFKVRPLVRGPGGFDRWGKR